MTPLVEGFASLNGRVGVGVGVGVVIIRAVYLLVSTYAHKSMPTTYPAYDAVVFPLVSTWLVVTGG